MSEQIREQIVNKIFVLSTTPEFIHAAHRCCGSESPDIVGLADMPQLQSTVDQILSLTLRRGGGKCPECIKIFCEICQAKCGHRINVDCSICKGSGTVVEEKSVGTILAEGGWK